MVKYFKFLAARLNHEYWPWYLIYLPIFPALIRTAFRLKAPVFFSVANPAIDMGGFFGERKSEIYSLLPTWSYPTTILVTPDLLFTKVMDQLNESGILFPFIAKPDVGERGDGVRIIRNRAELQSLLSTLTEPYLLQKLIAEPAEYGLMFVKWPTTGQVDLLSVTGKQFLSVKGDGTSTVAQLLANSWRGSKQIERLSKQQPDLMHSIPALNQTITVEPIGNHIRGTIFTDCNHLKSETLRQQLQQLFDQTDGIYYGRLDVKSQDDAALQSGQFTVIELNGVTSEPGLVYDPAYSCWKAWKEIYRHLIVLPTLSTQLISMGHQPVTLLQLVERSEQHFNRSMPLLKTIVKWLSPGNTHKVQLKSKSPQLL